MKSLNKIENESLSVCDGCSNWHICKFSEDVKRAEAEYKQFKTNWSSGEIPTGKKYEYDGLTYVNTGDPPFIYNEGSTCNTTE